MPSINMNDRSTSLFLASTLSVGVSLFILNKISSAKCESEAEVGFFQRALSVVGISGKSSGKSVRTALDELSSTGEFKRKAAAWRNKISREPDAEFPAEKGRYHLYVAYACPWAHRTLLTRAIKGLEDVISVTVVHPVWQKTNADKKDLHTGWIFGSPDDSKTLKNAKGLGGPFPTAYSNNTPDPNVFHAKSMRDLYVQSGDTDGKYSVPVLFDKKKNTIVSNESSEIIEMFNSEFNKFSKYPDLDLSPKELHEAMEEVNSWIYPNINNGVYRCGFATTQEAYDVAINDLTAAFDKVEELLKKRRYVAGDKFTLSDIRLFVTLLRFDEVYVVYFKTNTRRVMDSPTLLNYCREIYQMPGVKDTVNMEQIKVHYYCSHPTLNTYSIIPKGKGDDYVKMLEEPHNRDKM